MPPCAFAKYLHMPVLLHREQCVDTIRLRARMKEAATQGASTVSSQASLSRDHHTPSSTQATGPTERALSAQEQQRRVLESRRLLNRLEEKRRGNSRYREILQKRETLPAYQRRDEIVQAIAHNRVVVVSGDTGCGKTTQIPQLVLDAAIDAGYGANVNILVSGQFLLNIRVPYFHEKYIELNFHLS